MNNSTSGNDCQCVYDFDHAVAWNNLRYDQVIGYNIANERVDFSIDGQTSPSCSLFYQTGTYFAERSAMGFDGITVSWKYDKLVIKMHAIGDNAGLWTANYFLTIYGLSIIEKSPGSNKILFSSW